VYETEGRASVIGERQYLKENLYDVFAAILEAEGSTLQVIFEDQNGPRPKAPLISIQFGSSVYLGSTLNFTKVKLPILNGVIDEADNGLQKVYQPIRRTLTCYGFGEAALDWLEVLRTQLQIDRWVDELRRRRLVIPQVMEILEAWKDIDVVRETTASFDFDLGYIRVTEIAPGWIEQAELNPEYVLDENKK
jgi:hypothetical protein